MKIGQAFLDIQYGQLRFISDYQYIYIHLGWALADLTDKPVYQFKFSTYERLQTRKHSLKVNIYVLIIAAIHHDMDMYLLFGLTMRPKKVPPELDIICVNLKIMEIIMPSKSTAGILKFL